MEVVTECDSRNRRTAHHVDDLTGHRFDRLLVIGPSSVGVHGRRGWECRCDCGATRHLRAYSLLSGKSRSCGCYRADALQVAAAARRTHGRAGTDIYRIWRAVISRCTRKKDRAYSHYGGRGIRLCERWFSSFAAFIADMGERPSPEYSIDRKDNDGHYSCGKCSQCLREGWPANCHWATGIEQGRNSRRNRVIEFDGHRRCLSEWAEIYGIAREMIAKRLARGWTVERALTSLPTPPGWSRRKKQEI